VKASEQIDEWARQFLGHIELPYARLMVLAVLASTLVTGCRFPGQDQNEHRQPLGPTQTVPGWGE
jgi:hypothetical protein